MIAIQKAGGGFDKRWTKYCEKNNIDYKYVDCYSSNIIEQLKDCDALMWQFYQGSIKDMLMAKSLLFALEHSGIETFPDFKTSWHFDDKVGQKYLLESLGLPLAKSWVFYEKKSALEWAHSVQYPKVFKLRGGSGSQNVRLIKTKKQAISHIKRAFGKGFSQYDPFRSLHDRWLLYKKNKTSFGSLIKGIVRIIFPPKYSIVRGRERGYIYFQEYIPDNDHDIRVVVIGDKAFAIKRLVRENDFRASGSGTILYDKEYIDENTVKLALKCASLIDTQCVAFDFVYYKGKPLIVEISYGFTPSGYDNCPGYWDKDMTWHEGSFDPYGWMVEDVVSRVEGSSNR